VYVYIVHDANIQYIYQLGSIHLIIQCLIVYVYIVHDANIQYIYQLGSIHLIIQCLSILQH